MEGAEIEELLFDLTAALNSKIDDVVVVVTAFVIHLARTVGGRGSAAFV